jgi:hypothetical protein
MNRRLLPTMLPLALGLLLRLFFIHHDPDLSGDPLIYGSIARNLLLHGVYGFQPDLSPTLIRLPGYPLFLAGCFKLFGIPTSGVAQYHPVLYLQALIDLGTCLLLSRLAARLAPARSAQKAAAWTLWLSALCPFTACYTAAPLTETLELFSIAAAFYCFARTLALAPDANGPGVPDLSAKWFSLCTVAFIYAAMLRPDGALLGVVLIPALVFYAPRLQRRRAVRFTAFAALGVLLAFGPWTIRNWRSFHVFEPLAPRYATDPGEPIHPGFQRWTKTVCADLTCTAEVYWAADDVTITPDQLPSRAFDSPAQYRATADLLADYNRTTTITPALDARFAALADQRYAAHPVRFYLGMPLLRLADMWLRPRVELFNIDLRWWRYGPEGPDTIYAWAFAILNALYLALAIAGGFRGPPLLAVFLAFVALRCALLLTIEAPEPRYTLECFPVILVLGGVALAQRQRLTSSALTASLQDLSLSR